MAKLPHQENLDPVNDEDVVTKGYADANYAGGGGTATELATTGSAVNVDLADPPGAGQALVATSATTATWQNVAASGPIAAAQGAFITASVGTNHAAAPGTPIDIDTIADSRELTVDGSGRFSVLKAGRSYLLIGAVRITGTGANISVQWRDVTANAYIGAQGIVYTHDQDGLNGPGTVMAYITPTTDTEVELWTVSEPGATTISLFTHASIVEIGAVQANIVGGMEFMDEIEVTGSAVTSVTFGAAGSGKFLRALDGDVDEEYVIVSNIVTAGVASAAHFNLRPNGLAPSGDQESSGVAQVSGASPVGFDNLFLSIASINTSSFGTGTVSTFETSFTAKTGQKRAFKSVGGVYEPGNGDTRTVTSGGGWDDSTTKITSLEIIADQTANINVGSKFRLFRRTSNNLRADSADTYERQATAAIAEGASTTEVTMGHSIYSGSVVGMSVRCEDARTAGSVTCNLKIDGSTIDSLVIDATNTTSVRKVFSIGVNKFVGDKNVSVEFVADSGYLNAATGPTGFTFVAMLQNEALFHGPAGGLQHIKTIRIENSNQTTITFPNLDGDVDGIYLIEFNLRRDAANTTTDFDLYLNPNGLVTTQNSRQVNTNTGPGLSDVARLRIAKVAVVSNFDQILGSCRFFAKTNGFPRNILGSGIVTDDTNADGDHINMLYGGTWLDTATNVTSIELEASVASNIGIGSEFRLYRLTEQSGAVEIL